METYRVFVYGTLRRHEQNHHLLEKCECLFEQAWVWGELYDTGHGYPTLLRHESAKAYGEVYAVDASTLVLLDELEGYEGNRSNNLYERVETYVNTDKGEITCFVYICPSEVVSSSRIIHGDWRLHQFLQQPPQESLYFAYGSCMDDERFRLANKHHCFVDVLGSAVLHGYSMKYLFHAKDGGRADILEDGGVVEGILYRIPFEGVEYLFQREGFYGGWYRPTFIDVEVAGETVTNVMTFHVYEKKDEQAPPKHYSDEILRGAKGRLSESYYQHLVTEIERLEASRK